MACPVRGVSRLVFRNPGAGDARDKGDGWWSQLNLRDVRGKLVDDWVHHRRMESVRGCQSSSGNALIFQLGLETVQGAKGTGYNAERRRIQLRRQGHVHSAARESRTPR